MYVQRVSDRWYFGGLLWVPGEHPAESMLEAVGLRDAIPVGYRTREEITSRSFGANERLRAIFREAGWTFMLEPRGRRQSFRTLGPLSKRFGEAHAIAIDDINDIGEAASAKDGAITGSAQVEGGECELEGEPPRIELDAERSRGCVVGLLKKTTGLTLDQLVYFGTHEWAGSAPDASIAAVLDHEPVGEVFRHTKPSILPEAS